MSRPLTDLATSRSLSRAPPLPSVDALLVFEAAARHLSFTEAGRELGVTQAAVSHRMKLLEGQLGVPLFHRGPRRLSLTAHGEAWAAELRGIFARLREANRRLRARGPAVRPVVAISVIPSFGSRWLVPRLGRFLDRRPDVDVRVSASELLVDFALDPIDVGIRYGTGRYPGLTREKLADDAWIVVASPSLAAQRKLRSPRDLAGETLLCDDDPDAWTRWLAMYAGARTKPARRTEITDSSMLVEAAARGQGFALARRSLAMGDLEAGRLVLPFPALPPLPTGLAYYLAAPRENWIRPELQAFREWLREETAALRD